MGAANRTEIFVNLKRFDVPTTLGGICPDDSPARWIRSVIGQTVEKGLGTREDLHLTYLLPESLLIPALEALESAGHQKTAQISIGSQGVYREDIRPGGNFGAFTTNLPAAAAKATGVSWSIVGHSEERKDKISLLSAYDQAVDRAGDAQQRARSTVDEIVNQEALRAFESGISVLFCVGESEEERGSGSFEEQKPRITEALKGQVSRGLKGLSDYLGDRELVIGYEPIWAIGPGKTPPDAPYIDFVAEAIGEICQKEHGFAPKVVYGGGLKEANARSLGALASLSGGLVALTKFTPPIGFDPADLAVIADTFQKARP